MTGRIHGSGSRSETLLAKQVNCSTIRLRYQLAEDGCIESQVALAKSLLQEIANDSAERRSNDKLAVTWLLRAAERGHQEAFDLLELCNSTGVGITLENRFSVEKCLRLSANERIASRAGHSICRAIMSDTDESMPEETFQKRVEVIMSQEKKESEVTSSCSGDSVFKSSEAELPKQGEINAQSECTKPVSVHDIMCSVHQCLEGNLPLVALRRVVQYEEYNKWFSLKYARITWEMICRALEVLIRDLGSAVLPCTIFFSFLLLWVLSNIFMSRSELNFFIDKYFNYCVVLVCLFTMLCSTCYIIYMHFGYYSVNKWLNLIKMFEPSAKPEEAKQKYLKKALFPFFAFFICSVFFIIMYPAALPKFPVGELSIVSALLFLLIDRTITLQRYHVNISLMLNILLCLYKGDFLQNTQAEWLKFFNFDIWFAVTEHIEIHINLISCITLPFVLPYLYLKMVLGSERKGWKLVLLPHLMSLIWMNIMFNNLKTCDTSTLIVSFCSWLVILFLANYIGALSSLFLCIFAQNMYQHENLYGTFFMIAPLFIINCLVSSYLVKKITNISKSKIFLFTLILILVTYFNQKSPSLSTDLSEVPLNWNQYQNHCHRHAWYQTNTAEVEIACLPLKGKTIALEGTITSIDVIDIQNRLQQISYALPSPLYEWFTCSLGDTFNDCDAKLLSPLEKERCIFFQNLNLSSCHLHRWDVYKYSVQIEVSSRTSPEVNVIADHFCTSFIKSLKEGDTLHVVGTLHDKLGSANPVISLIESTCNSCYENTKCKTVQTVSHIDYSIFLKNFISFCFSPFIQYVN